MGSREATFGFVDLAGFTALTEAHGDAEAVELIERFELITRNGVGANGQLVKMIGDAAMVVFTDPGSAVAGVGRVFDAFLSTGGLPLPRAGLHHGTAIERSGDYLGAAVNLAARVTNQAHGGQVLATEVVAQAARDRGVLVSALGCFELHNITSPVELFDLDFGVAAEPTTIDPVCRMQVLRAAAAGVLRHADHDYWFCSLRCAASFAAQPGTYARISSS